MSPDREEGGGRGRAPLCQEEPLSASFPGHAGRRPPFPSKALHLITHVGGGGLSWAAEGGGLGRGEGWWEEERYAYFTHLIAT